MTDSATSVPTAVRAPEGDLAHALISAHQQLVDAERAFRELMTEARVRGASVRQIAEVLDVPPMNVWRWSGGSVKKANPLEAPR